MLIKRKKILAALRETINESRSSKYKYIFFHQDLTWKQREIAMEKELIELQPVRLKNSRVKKAQQGSRDSLFHNLSSVTFKMYIRLVVNLFNVNSLFFLLLLQEDVQ